MKIKLLLVTAVILLIASCQKANEDAPIPDSNQSIQLQKSAPVSRPLSGSIHYNLSNTHSLPCACNPGFFSTGFYYGTGNLAHLGFSASVINPCVQYSATGIHVGTECNTLTAANGDQLFCLIAPYNLSWIGGGDATGVSQVDITGGTGRFTGASGHFSGLVTIHTLTNTADFSGISGNITY